MSRTDIPPEVRAKIGAAIDRAQQGADYADEDGPLDFWIGLFWAFVGDVVCMAILAGVLYGVWWLVEG